MEFSHFKLRPTLEKRRYRFLLFVLFYIIQFCVVWIGIWLIDPVTWNFIMHGLLHYYMLPIVVVLFLFCDHIFTKKKMFKSKHNMVFLAYLISSLIAGLIMFAYTFNTLRTHGFFD